MKITLTIRGNSAPLSLLKAGRFMRVSGAEPRETATAFKFGLTEPSMKGVGSRIGLMDTESSFTQMGMCMRGNGNQIRLVVSEPISIPMALPIKGDG